MQNMSTPSQTKLNASHPPPPILLRRTQRAIILHARLRHQHLPRFLGLILDILAHDAMAPSPHERHKRYADQQRQTQE